MDTKAVVEHHLEALKAGDVEETLADYTDDSVLIVPGAVLKGLGAIRPAFTQACETLFKPGTFQFELESLDVEGEIGFITWHATFEAGEATFGTDTFVVRDGKIAVQTGGVKLEAR